MKVQRFTSYLLAALSIAASESRAQQQSALHPSAAKVEFENDQIRVLRASVAARHKTPMHEHPSRFGVTITPNDLRVYLPDGASTTSTRAAHQYFWSEPITHQVENLSDSPMQNIEIELKRAKSAGLELRPALGESKGPATARDPVAVEQEPHHRVVFENQYVRVLEVLVNAGDTTLWHRHSLDNVAIQVSDATIKRQYPDQEWSASVAQEGQVSFNSGTTTPYIHRIANTGATVFHVFDVEILP